MTIASWIVRLIVVAIFAMGAIPKFTGGAGELAELLPGGAAAVYAIGAIEVLAIILLLIPKTALVGSALAVVVMLGAIGSHIVGPVGTEGDFASMFIMALIAFAAAVASLVIQLKGKCAIGCKPAESAPA
jgi:uncharacterized membrane protein YphA (DoxX/SURF4 family)